MFSAEQTPSSAFRFQHSSPLDALVRHSSAKRARAVVQSTASSQQYPSSLIDEYAAPQSVDEREIDLKLSAAHMTVPNGSQPTSQNSTAPIAVTSSIKSRNVNMNVEYQNRNDESVYSRVIPLCRSLLKVSGGLEHILKTTRHPPQGQIALRRYQRSRFHHQV